MAKSFDYRIHPYRRSPDQDAATPARHPVVVAGGGMVGLAFAADMAQRGVAVVVLDEGNQVSIGSRSICVAKRTLEIFDRLGIGERCAEKGVTWSKGKVLRGDDLLYAFDLLPEPGHKHPAFINLQQYYVEQYLVERCSDFPDLIDLRFKNEVTTVEQDDNSARANVETPDGSYVIEVDYLLACDGVNSAIRRAMGLHSAASCLRNAF